MSDISTVAGRYNGADLEIYDKASGATVLAFRNAIGSLMVEGASEALTAHAGGGQTSALALTSAINRITTVTTAGDSVALPLATPGLDVIIINHGANPLQAFGAGTDTIDDVATATGVSQMAGSVTLYYCTVAGKWYSEGIGTGYSGQYPTQSYTNSITAHAGGGQGAATPLTTVLNRVTTVVTIADSVLLPASAPGMQIMVANAATNSMNVFPVTGDAINALGANAAFAIAGGKTATFYSCNAGNWHAILSA